MRIRISSPGCRSSIRPVSSHALLTAAVIAAVAVSLPAQPGPGLQFAEIGKRHLPEGGAAAVATGDVDGDGDVDLVCGNHGQTHGQNRLYLNIGSGCTARSCACRRRWR